MRSASLFRLGGLLDRIFGSAFPTFPEALQEQLGFKLKSTT